MVSILPGERTPLDVIGKLIGEGLSRTLPGAVQRGYERAALQNSINQLNPQADIFEQLKTLAPALSVPGGAQALQSFQKARENQERQRQFDDIFRPPPNEAGGQAQNTPDFSNVSDESLARLSIVDPQRANALRQIVQSQRQQKADQQKSDIGELSNAKFSAGYEAIENDDMDALNEIIKDPKTPYEVKKGLSNLKNQHDVRKDVKAREIRTRHSFLKNAYSRAIEAEKNRMNVANFKDKPEIRERIENLIRNQRKDMKKFSEDPESYPKLGIWNTEASQFLPEEEFEEKGFGTEDRSKGQKVLFNPKNPAHLARAKEVLSQVGGDKAKANAILFEEFDK